ncbi:MAG: hypothetical protein HY901_30685 [Deltaproteobacteria bacterium]|nr:hypothetical protein [Deltaproteobacteria bacterium]
MNVRASRLVLLLSLAVGACSSSVSEYALTDGSSSDCLVAALAADGERCALVWAEETHPFGPVGETLRAIKLAGLELESASMPAINGLADASAFALVAAGASYGVAAYQAMGEQGIDFYLVDPASGAKTGGVRIPDAELSSEALVWTGERFALAYRKRLPSGNWPLYLATIDAKATAMERELALTEETTDYELSLAWSGAGFGVAYRAQDGRLLFKAVDPALEQVRATAVISEAAPEAHRPQIASSQTEYAVSWEQYVESPPQITTQVLFRRVASDGSLPGSPLQVSSAGRPCIESRLVWAKDEWGVGWNQDDGATEGGMGYYFRRLTPSGAADGDPARITQASHLRALRLAWTGKRYLFAWSAQSVGTVPLMGGGAGESKGAWQVFVAF